MISPQYTQPPISEIVRENATTYRVQGIDHDKERAIIKARAMRDAFKTRLPATVLQEAEDVLTERFADYGLIMCLIRLYLDSEITEELN
jgi:hypothetical protein